MRGVRFGWVLVGVGRLAWSMGYGLECWVRFQVSSVIGAILLIWFRGSWERERERESLERERGEGRGDGRNSGNRERRGR